MNGLLPSLASQILVIFVLPTVSVVFEITHFVQFALHTAIWHSIIFYMTAVQKVGMQMLPFKISRTEIFVYEISQKLHCVC